MPNYAIGIDAGGTFTDGVIFDLDSKKIIVKTKVITSRNNLIKVIDKCLDNLLTHVVDLTLLNHIRMISLSTTLATNAIVEGQGADVGLIMIGIETDRPLPTKYYINVKGKFDIKGKEKQEIDLKSVREAIQSMKGSVEAFAVSGYMSIRNPSHELMVEKIIKDMTGYPVVCGHQLSSDLGVYERTVTAVLNARLIKLITDLIAAVKVSASARKISAPIMVVKGDGSLISEDTARARPIETILSGPAASVIGGMALSGLDDGIVIDMGGTTTDIAVLKNGKLRINGKGASVGGWRTRVKAADITTIGLGGDSLIKVTKDRNLIIGPQRVFPLSWIAYEYPYLLEELRNIRNSNYSPLDSQPTCILFRLREPKGMNLSQTEKNLLENIKDEPHSIYYLSNKLNIDPNLIPWERLVKIGSIHRANCTPTDILHVLGAMERWHREAALLGVEIMANRYGKDVETFVNDVLEKIYYGIFTLIFKTTVMLSNSIDLRKDSQIDRLLQRMFIRHEHNDQPLELQAHLKIPVIGLGAPVKEYLPEAVKRFNGKVVVPENADVANAVGTVNGKVVERVRIIIKPGESGGYYVYTPEGRHMFLNFNECIDYSEDFGRKYVYSRAKSEGASEIEVFVERNDRYSILGGQKLNDFEDSEKIFIESIVEVTAQGRPWLQ